MAFLESISFSQFFFPKFQKQPFTDVLHNRRSLNFAIITGKHLCWSLFSIKRQAFRPTVITNITKFLRAGSFKEHLWCLVLKFLFQIKIKRCNVQGIASNKKRVKSGECQMTEQHFLSLITQRWKTYRGKHVRGKKTVVSGGYWSK